MQKTILIPTDFSIESLMLLKHAAMSHENNTMEVFLFCCTHLNDSISDLLFYSPTRIIEPLISDVYREACSILLNKYSSRITDMRIVVFHGRTVAAFNNFALGLKADEAFIPKTYKFSIYKNGFDPMPFIKKSKLKVTVTDWNVKKNIPEKNKLADLFLD